MIIESFKKKKERKKLNQTKKQNNEYTGIKNLKRREPKISLISHSHYNYTKTYLDDL